VTRRSLPEPLELIPSDQLKDADDVAGGEVIDHGGCAGKGAMGGSAFDPPGRTCLAGTCDAWSWAFTGQYLTDRLRRHGGNIAYREDGGQRRSMDCLPSKTSGSS